MPADNLVLQRVKAKSFVLGLVCLVGLAAPPASIAKEGAVFRRVTPTKFIRPDYPRAALRDGLCGVVYVQVTVDDMGRVKDYKFLKAYPPGIFEAAVEPVIAKYEFSKIAPDGTPAPYRAVIPFKFIIDQEKVCKNGPLPEMPSEYSEPAEPGARSLM
jgi:TonB family protein